MNAVAKHFTSARTLRLAAGRALAAFGLLSATVELAAIWLPPTALSPPALYLSLLAVSSVGYGVASSWPRSSAQYRYRLPDVTIESRVVDHLELLDHHIVVGFTDTFDTDTSNDVIIHGSSVQGRFLKTYYHGDVSALDRDIDAALSSVSPLSLEASGTKEGKLARYPLGTVAVLGTPRRRVFCLACGILGNDLIVRSDINLIWESLSCLWDVAERYSQYGNIAIPIIGSHFARLTNLDRQSLIKIIAMSFLARSRMRPVASRLTITVWPADAALVDMQDIEYYLKSI